MSYIHNSKNTQFPKEFKKHKIVWNLREALLHIWEGKVTELVIPKLGTPGYNFPEFIEQMKKLGQIKKTPNIKYYELNIIKRK